MNFRVMIQKQDAETEEWADWKKFTAYSANRTSSREYSISDTEFSSDMVTLIFRWSKSLSEIDGNTQLYRCMFRGGLYDITSYDDPLYKHDKIRLILSRIHN